MKKRSIAFKIISQYSLMIAIILVAVIISLNIIYNISIESLDSQARTLNSVVSLSFDETFNYIDSDSRDILVATETQDFLRHVNTGSTQNKEYFDLFTDWSEFLNSSTQLWQGYIRTVGLIGLSKEIHSYGYEVEQEMHDFILSSPNLDNFDEYSTSWLATEIDGNNYLVLIRPVRDLEFLRLSEMGYLFYIMDFERLFLENSYSTIGENTVYSSIYINGDLIYTNSDHEFPISILDNIDKSQGATTYINGTSKYVLSSHYSSKYSMQYYVSQDITTLYNNLGFYTLLLVGGILLLSLTMLFVVLRNIFSITGRIRNLTQRVTEAYDNNFKLDSNDFLDNIGDELTVLSINFKALINKIDEQVNEILVRKLLFKEAQIRLFQSQINPHFLYNSLDTINALAQINNIKPISDMSMSIASVMRYSLEETIISDVESELDILRKYLTVQRLRYYDRLIVEVKTCGHCHNIEMPKMIFQPLVENAVKYSAELKESTAHIKLNVKLKSNNLMITVIDNGIGIDTDIMLLLKSKEFDQLSGHGLKNTFLRLENLFGDNLKVKVRSAKGRYTAIRITIYDQGDFKNVEKN